MSKSKKNLVKFDQSIDRLFNLLNKIDLESLNDIKSLKKEAQIIKKEIETNTKNLDSKK